MIQFVLIFFILFNQESLHTLAPQTTLNESYFEYSQYTEEPHNIIPLISNNSSYSPSDTFEIKQSPHSSLKTNDPPYLINTIHNELKTEPNIFIFKNPFFLLTLILVLLIVLCLLQNFASLAVSIQSSTSNWAQILQFTTSLTALLSLVFYSLPIIFIYHIRKQNKKIIKKFQPFLISFAFFIGLNFLSHLIHLSVLWTALHIGTKVIIIIFCVYAVILSISLLTYTQRNFFKRKLNNQKIYPLSQKKHLFAPTLKRVKLFNSHLKGFLKQLFLVSMTLFLFPTFSFIPDPTFLISMFIIQQVCFISVCLLLISAIAKQLILQKKKFALQKSIIFLVLLSIFFVYLLITLTRTPLPSRITEAFSNNSFNIIKQIITQKIHISTLPIADQIFIMIILSNLFVLTPFLIISIILTAQICFLTTQVSPYAKRFNYDNTILTETPHYLEHKAFLTPQDYTKSTCFLILFFLSAVINIILIGHNNSGLISLAVFGILSFIIIFIVKLGQVKRFILKNGEKDMIKKVLKESVSWLIITPILILMILIFFNLNSLPSSKVLSGFCSAFGLIFTIASIATIAGVYRYRQLKLSSSPQTPVSTNETDEKTELTQPSLLPKISSTLLNDINDEQIAEIEEYFVQNGLYDSYINLQYKTQCFINSLINIEQEFPLLNHIILKHHIKNTQTFKQTLVLIRHTLNHEKQKQLKKEEEKWIQNNMDIFLPEYILLWQSTLKKIHQDIQEQYPQTYQYINAQENPSTFLALHNTDALFDNILDHIQKKRLQTEGNEEKESLQEQYQCIQKEKNEWFQQKRALTWSAIQPFPQEEEVITSFPRLNEYINTLAEKGIDTASILLEEHGVLQLFNNKLEEIKTQINSITDQLTLKELHQLKTQIQKEQEMWEQYPLKQQWLDFKQVPIQENSLSFKPVGIYLKNQIRHSLLVTLYLLKENNYQWTQKSKQQLPSSFRNTQQETSIQLSVNIQEEQDFQTPICQAISSKISLSDLELKMIKKYDGLLLQKKHLCVLEEVNTFVPVILQSSNELLLLFLTQLKQRINMCEVAIQHTPIDLYEIYFQYPPTLTNLDEAFVHITTEKRTSVAKKIGNEGFNHSVHSLRQTLYQLSKNGLSFHPFLLPHKKDHIIVQQHFDSYYLKKFNDLFTPAHLMIEEIIPLFWQLHTGTSGAGKQFCQCAIRNNLPFMDVQKDDEYFEGSYLFTDPIALLTYLEQEGFIKASPTSTQKKLKLNHKKDFDDVLIYPINSKHINNIIRRHHPQRFFEYLYSLDEEQQQKFLNKIDFSGIIDHLFPPHSFEKRIPDLNKILDFMKDNKPMTFFITLKSLYSYYEKEFITQHVDFENKIKNDSLKLVIKLIQETQIENIQQVFNLLTNGFLYSAIIPPLFKIIPDLKPHEFNTLKLALNSKELNLFFSCIQEKDLQQLLQIISIQNETKISIFTHIYKRNPEKIVSFFKILYPETTSLDSQNDSKTDCIIHFIKANIEIEKNLITFLINNATSEKKLLEWVVPYYETLQQNDTLLKEQVLTCLKINRYHQIIYKIIDEEGDINKLNSFICTAFLDEGFEFLHQCSQEWMKDKSKHQYALETLYLCTTIKTMFVETPYIYTQIINQLLRNSPIKNFPTNTPLPPSSLVTITKKIEQSNNFENLDGTYRSLEEIDLQLIHKIIILTLPPEQITRTFYLGHPQLIYPFYKIFILNNTAPTLSESDCLTHLVSHFSSPYNKSFIEFFIRKGTEEHIDLWIKKSLENKSLSEKEKFIESTTSFLNKWNRYEALMNLYRHLNETQKADALLFTLFSKRKWSLIQEWALEWLSNIDSNIHFIESLFSLFELTYKKKTFNDEFYQLFDNSDNPLLPLYTFYQYKINHSPSLSIQQFTIEYLKSLETPTSPSEELNVPLFAENSIDKPNAHPLNKLYLNSA